MKILFLVSSLEGGGAERVASNLCSEWAQMGMDVTLMTTYAKKQTVPYALHPSVSLIHLASLMMRRRSKLDRLLALRVFIAKGGFDIVVSFLTNVNVAVLLATIGFERNTIVSERIYPPLAVSEVPFWLRALRRLLYFRAGVLVGQTNATADWLRACFPWKDVRVIPNSVQFPLRAKDSGEHHSTQIMDGNLILSVGRLEAQKRFDILIRAFAGLAVHNPDWGLAIVGAGTQHDMLNKLIDDLGMNDRVSLVAFTKDIDEWYEKASIFVLPSAYEGFPNALMEAMSYGVASIAFDIKSGPSELIGDSEYGLLLPDDYHEARLQQALEILITDEVRRVSLGELAKSVKDRFSWKQIQQVWAMALTDIASQCGKN